MWEFLAGRWLKAQKGNVMATTNRKKQLRVRRIYVCRSFSDERVAALFARIREIVSGFDCGLEEAIQEAIAEFDTLVREGYTPDEIEAVFRDHNPGYFEHSVYRNLRDVWRRDWVPESERADLGSTPTRKGATT